jgi:hypothetical protein
MQNLRKEKILEVTYDMPGLRSLLMYAHWTGYKLIEYSPGPFGLTLVKLQRKLYFWEKPFTRV